MGRPLLADPDLPRKAEEGRFDQIRRCIACNSCRREPWPREIPICCLLNPETGREGEPETPALHPRRVLVIGAGPAGLEAARVARLRGHLVTLWEEASTPAGRWSFLLHRYVRQQLKELHQLGVRVELNKWADPQTVTELNPQVVLATPPPVFTLPAIPGIERQEVVLAQSVLEGKARLGGRVVVWGGDSRGCEVALHLSRRGAQITVLESGNILGYGLDPATSKVLVERLRHQGVGFLSGVQVVEIRPGAVACRDSQGRELEVPADAVVLAQGEGAAEALPEWITALPVDVHPLPYCGEPRNAVRAAQAGASLARQL